MTPDLTTPASLTLTIEKPIYGGDCLAHAEGKAVFVPLTLPGETVTAAVTEEKRKVLGAEVQQILTPSENRIEPRCPHYGVCGGCHYQHADYPMQLRMKQQVLRETMQRAGVPLPETISELSNNPWQYRNRIRLAVTEDGRLGYRSRRSHDLVPIRECPIAAPLLMEVALQLSSIIDTKDPRNGLNESDLAEVDLFGNRDGSEVLLTFQHDSEGALFRKLRLTPGDGLARPGIALSDEQHLTYRAAGYDYHVPHGAFFQVNRWLIDDFVALVTGGLSGKTAWDLYAGVGLFARRLAESFSEVVAVESAPASLPGLERNLAGTSGRAMAATTVEFLRRNREEREPGPDLIVLDPPRAGLGSEVTSLLNAIGAPAMVYVSCDPVTLARDLRALTVERYRIERVTLVDMFPQTFHLETVVHLSRC